MEGSGAPLVAAEPSELTRRQIAAGQRSLQCIRWSVSGTLFLLSLLLGVSSTVFFNRIDGHRLAHASDSLAQPHIEYFASALSRNVPYLAWNLVPMANDLWLTRVVLLMDALWTAGEHHVHTDHIRKHPRLPSWLKSFLVLGARVVGALKVLGFLWLMCQRECSTMQTYMWNFLAGSFILESTAYLCTIVATTSHCHCLAAGWWFLLWHIASIWFACQPQWRQSIHAKLTRMYSRHYSYRAAASIAGLVGHCSANEVLAQASRRFRGIHLKDLVFDDLADNEPNPALFERTFPVELLTCDAFISHSWHDDAQSKWDALQRWRWRFFQANGREPVLWLDKCCIDQEDIVESLRCLPIFLSGCQKLVVLLGDTYLRRLWCILEIFTFVHMRCGVDRIECISLGPCGSQTVPRRNLKVFDASACECFKPEEKVTILQIICAAYGDLGSFNAAVRDILRAALGSGSSGSESGSSDSDTRSSPSSRHSSAGSGESSTPNEKRSPIS